MAKILVVEDQATWRSIARHALGAEHALTMVTTRAEAQAALDRESWDLVILDLGLPDSWGHATFETLAGTYYLHGLPVQSIKGIPVLTATGAEQEQEYGPLVLYRGKPTLVDHEQYRAAVSTLLEQGKAYKTLPEGEACG